MYFIACFLCELNAYRCIRREKSSLLASSVWNELHFVAKSYSQIPDSTLSLTGIESSRAKSSQVEPSRAKSSQAEPSRTNPRAFEYLPPTAYAFIILLYVEPQAYSLCSLCLTAYSMYWNFPNSRTSSILQFFVSFYMCIIYNVRHKKNLVSGFLIREVELLIDTATMHFIELTDSCDICI